MFRVLTSPRLVALHLVAIVAVSAAIWLGTWQYDAWQTRRQSEVTDLANARPVPLARVMTADEPFPGDSVGRPVRFAGTWVGDASFYVAERELDGRSGFWVVTPVAVCPGSDCSAADPAEEPAMLVVRGWAPTVDAPAAEAAPAGPVAVTGWLQPAEGAGIQDPDPADDVLAELRIADAIQRVDQDLYGGYVIADELSGPGAARAAADLEPVTPGSLPEPSSFTALRNLLYAVEWWVFGAFALFVWWRWVNDEVARQRGDAAGVPSSP